jgi:uncharacterized protein
MSVSRFILGLCLLASQAAGALALEIPKLQARVTDLAGLLSPEQVSTLDAKLQDLETGDSTQIAILIVPSLEGEVLEDYTVRVATAWRLGQKGRDNGALLIVAMKERKMRIEVGYGLESNLTDARSHRIIQDEIIPRFRQGQYFEGIDAGISAMIGTVRGVYQAPAHPAGSGSGRPVRRSYDWLFFLLFPLLWFLGSTGTWGGGILGLGAGAYLAHSLAGFMLIPLLFGGILGGVVGAVIGALVSAAGHSSSFRRGGGGGIPFSFGGGGGFSGGGGGFSGGGFSGGGGSFGGGGSSGSW